MFMAILDIQIVASSLPEIQAGLGIPLDQLSWVQTAYLMAEIVAIPLTGWLTLMLSTRGAFVACVGGFTAASFACAASTGFWSLIPARDGAGVLRRGADPARVFGDLSDVRLAGADASDLDRRACSRCWLRRSGPVIGGFVTDRFSWHWLFLINVPPGIVGGVAGRLGGRCRPPRPPPLRLGRSVGIAVARSVSRRPRIVAEGGAEARLGRAPRCCCSPAVCAVCGVGLLRRSLRHPAPLIDLSAFRDRNFAIGCASALRSASGFTARHTYCRCFSAWSATTTRCRSARS